MSNATDAASGAGHDSGSGHSSPGDSEESDEGSSHQDWLPVLMLAIGMFALLAVLGLMVKRMHDRRRRKVVRDYPASFSNPIYDVALASLRQSSAEGIAEAEDALVYERQQYPSRQAPLLDL